MHWSYCSLVLSHWLNKYPNMVLYTLKNLNYITSFRVHISMVLSPDSQWLFATTPTMAWLLAPDADAPTPACRGNCDRAPAHRHPGGCQPLMRRYCRLAKLRLFVCPIGIIPPRPERGATAGKFKQFSTLKSSSMETWNTVARLITS